MAKYSRVYKTESGGRFRYNYDTGMLQYIMKPTAEILQDDDFAVVIDGECIIDQIGIFPEDWQESPQYWCEQYEEDINAECAAWLAYEI